MQRDVKIGIAIGVLLLALIAIFWWMKSTNEATLPPQRPPEVSGTTLPEPVEPVAPVGGPTLPAVSEPSGPEVSLSGPTVEGAAPAGPSQPTSPAGTTPPVTSGEPLVPSPVEPVNPPAPAQQTHTVASGDTLSSLSKKYYGDEKYWSRIYEANKSTLPNPNALKVGMTLVIPAADASASSTTPTATRERTHTVGAGDTLSGIAKKYYGSEAKWRLIYNANSEKIPSPDRLQVGTVLVIPPEQ